MNKLTISIIGLGKLGSPMAAVFASKGWKVIGVDTNPNFVQLINEGVPPVFEPKLAELLKENKKRISAIQDYEKAILNSDITFIVVPTPSEENGRFSTKYVVEAGKEIGKVLKKKFNFHLVVLTSTVVPGSTEEEILPVLEEYSGKRHGEDFGFCYNPEFIALGDVIDGLLNPDFVLIGESDRRSGDILEDFYKIVCENNPPIKRMNIINAEIAKIALNVYITTKISYANMLAELCEKFPGGDVDVITDALGCDRRIGHKYLKGALGYGGPCFPRDTRAFLYTAKKVNLSFSLPEAVDFLNKRQATRIVENILFLLNKNQKVAILGLSYKPNTDIVEESQGVEIAKILTEKGISVLVYDPKAMDRAREVLGNKVEFAFSLKDCCQRADLILIATPWPEFKDIKQEWLKGKVPKIIVDCWKILEPEKLGTIKYWAIGKYFPER